MGGTRRFWPWMAAALIAVLLWLAAGQRPPERKVLAVLDAAQAAALCSASGYPLGEFWERVQIMGVGAVYFKEETLADLSARGELLFLQTPTPNALWLRNDGSFKRILAAAQRRGISTSTAGMAGYPVVEFPGGVSPVFGVGYDEASVSLAESKKLFPLLGSWEPRGEVWARSVLSAASQRPALLRAVYSHPRQMVLFSLDASLGLEDNLSLLRSALKFLRARGIVMEQAQASKAAAPAPPLSSWRPWLAWTFSVLGPLFAARTGLQAFKKARSAVLERWPMGSPIVEIGAGFLCVIAVALGAGLLVSLTLGRNGEAGLMGGLASSALAVPLIIGALALYPVEAGHWKKRLGQALTLGGVARAFLILLLVLLLFKPRLVLSSAGVWPWAQKMSESCQWLWWWRWRWREILLGFPALLYAFFLLERRLDCPDCRGGGKGQEDPRIWLLLGLVGSCGVVGAVGGPGVALAMALSQTAVAVVLGAFIGAVGIVLRWSIRPRAS